MSSNEHPDMSGNWADAPFLCHHCGEPFPEHKAYGTAGNDELLFCSADCVFSYEDARIEAMHPGNG